MSRCRVLLTADSVDGPARSYPWSRRAPLLLGVVLVFSRCLSSHWRDPRMDLSWIVSTRIAHRGLHDQTGERPENSLPAFEEAARLGYSIEFDIRRSADGRLFVVHDERLLRLTGADKQMRQLTSTEVRSLSLGRTRFGIPTLSETLSLINGRVPILIEVKDRGPGAAIVRAVLEELGGYKGHVAIQSFNPVCLWHLRRARTHYAVGQISALLSDAPRPISFLGRTMSTNFVTRPDFVAIELGALPSRSATFWRNRGLPVLAWPVRTIADERRAIARADNFAFDGYRPASGP